MTVQVTQEEIFRTLAPFNRLTSAVQTQLWERATVRTLAAGQMLFARASEDDWVHFVLEGQLDVIDQGRFVQRINPSQRIARRPLDSPGPRRFTVRAYVPSIAVMVPRAEIMRAVAAARMPIASDALLAEPKHSSDGDWMSRILTSNLFKALPGERIQTLFETLQSIEFLAEETIIRQDDAGDYFYLLESGHCEVLRRLSAGRQEVYVYDLQAGDTFGEAALLSGRPRDASVIALTDCRLLRLAKADFEQLIGGELVQSIAPAEALTLLEAGSARWLDISDPEVYAKGRLPDSLNIPLNALRAQLGQLARDTCYLVCSDEPELNRVGAYVLAEHGFKARCVSESVVMLLNPTANAVDDGAVSSASNQHNVLQFPTQPVAPVPIHPKVMAMDAVSLSSPPSDIPERTDRLYTQQQFNAALSADRAPTAALSDTGTIHNLAKLMDDIDTHKAALEQGDHAVFDITAHGTEDTGETEFIDLSKLEATAGPGAIRTPAKATESPLDPPVLDPSTLAAELGDPVAEFIHDFERRLRNYVEGSLMERAIEIERRYQEKASRLQTQAQNELRKRDAALKQKYALHYQKKDQQMRDTYQKLMTLATKISQQKTQLQQARQQFEEKLKAANAVYKQVEDMRRLLGENMGVVDSSGNATPRANAR